ncbi:MAG: choloylglycine hydrolase family protein [Clostridia bacterium]|nr:choloylglycine hydrolase family protein [Clostridia bacterium]
MCTAVTYKTKNFYFGRTLDYGFSYAEEVVVTPRNFALNYGDGILENHYAIIGTAYVPENYPLYYDGVNEKGLCMAGLNFVGNAVYRKPVKGKVNVPQYAVLPYILGKCATVKQAVKELEKINITPARYSEYLPVAELHWIIADKSGAITVESVKEGLKIYPNPVGVLTNNPQFPVQLFNLNNYLTVTARKPRNGFSDKLNLKPYSQGMGGIGLPGDYSSQSRFVRAAFTKLNSVSGNSEEESISQFFHILGSVEVPRGSCILGKDEYETTIYSSCCNADKGIYYYSTYQNRAITAVDMNKENLGSSGLFRYPFIRKEKISFQN